MLIFTIQLAIAIVLSTLCWMLHQPSIYSGDLNTELVPYSNGPLELGRQIVQYSNAILIPDGQTILSWKNELVHNNCFNKGDINFFRLTRPWRLFTVRTTRSAAFPVSSTLPQGVPSTGQWVKLEFLTLLPWNSETLAPTDSSCPQHRSFPLVRRPGPSTSQLPDKSLKSLDKSKLWLKLLMLSLLKPRTRKVFSLKHIQSAF